MKKLENIISDFIIIDNIPEDFELRKEFCEEDRSSLQIGSGASSLPSLMKSGTYDEGCSIFLLKEPIVIDFEAGDETLQAEFKRFSIYNGKVPPPDEFGQRERARLKINPYPSSHVNAPRPIWGAQGAMLIKCCNGDIVDFRKVIVQAIAKFNELSLFDLVKDISPYNTPGAICRFFGNAPDVFAPLKLSSNRIDCFHNHKQNRCSELEKLLDFNPSWSEEALLQYLLHDFSFKNKRDFALTSAHEKIYDGWLRQVISFEDELGEIVMVVVKIYLPQIQAKVLIPVSNWMEKSSPNNRYFCVPLPKKQILLNLKQLVKEDVSTVILTDSIELASVNQVNVPKGAVWTSFICSPGKYSQVDFSPLRREGIEIYLLITNHSGKSLEESYIESRGLANHLVEEYDLNLKFIQVEVDYHEK